MSARGSLAARAGRPGTLAVVGLALMAGAAPGAKADETPGDVNLPALTPEEIAQLGLETTPGSADTVAPQDVGAGPIPDDQGAVAPVPEEVVPPVEPDPEPAPAPIAVPAPAEVPAPIQAPAPAAPAAPAAPPAPAPAPVEAPAPTPVAPVAEPKRPAEPLAEPRRRPATRPRQPIEPPRIGVQPRPPARYAATAAVVPRPLPVAAAAPAKKPARPAARGQRRVRAGESLWSIATELAGPGASPASVAAGVERLWRLNRDRIRTGDPDVLPTGVELVT